MNRLGYRGLRSTPPKMHPLARTLAMPLGDVPQRYSLRGFVDRILNQGKLGSCTWNALAQAFYIRLAAQHETPFFVSRLAGYEMSLVYDGGAPGAVNDIGTFILTALEVASIIGVAAEALWPYVAPEDTEYGVLLKLRQQPDMEYVREAYDRRDATHTSWHQITGDDAERITAVKRLISSGYPVLDGGDVTVEFAESEDFGPSTVWGAPTGDIAGGHATTIIGYHDTPTGTIFEHANSWGPQWGNGGFFNTNEEFVRSRTELIAVEHLVAPVVKI